MVTPVLNGRPPASGEAKSETAAAKEGGAIRRDPTAADPATATRQAATADETLQIDRARQLYHSAQSQNRSPAERIGSAAEAAQLATRIRQQLATQGAEALQAQAGAGLSRAVGSLLESANSGRTG